MKIHLLPCGPTAWMIEVDDDAAVLAVARFARTLADVEEVVPGARTVLVQLAAGGRLDDLAARLQSPEALAMTQVRPPVRPEVVLPVVYDGADLARVAEACALSVDEVVRRHAGSTYRSSFCGFAPGFAYLTGLDPVLHLPRREAPRSKVPAGSVAIATHYSAVYPTSSPGGWHLLGHTDAVLFDPEHEPPALLSPGTLVRFQVNDA